MARKKTSRTAAAPVIRKFKSAFRWNNVKLEPYKIAAHREGEFCGASRQVLVGNLGEETGFHLRYFELESGGFTSLERHRPSHVIIGAAGSGHVRVGNSSYRLKQFDTIYIGPNQPHQLRASGGQKFGFFCIVNARRDKPRPVSEKNAK